MKHLSLIKHIMWLLQFSYCVTDHDTRLGSYCSNIIILITAKKWISCVLFVNDLTTFFPSLEREMFPYAACVNRFHINTTPLFLPKMLLWSLAGWSEASELLLSWLTDITRCWLLCWTIQIYVALSWYDIYRAAVYLFRYGPYISVRDNPHFSPKCGWVEKCGRAEKWGEGEQGQTDQSSPSIATHRSEYVPEWLSSRSWALKERRRRRRVDSVVSLTWWHTI